MKTRLKVGLTFLLTLVLLYSWHLVALLLNMPFTLAILAGGVLVTAGFVVTPILYHRIWRKNNESQEKPVA